MQDAIQSVEQAYRIYVQNRLEQPPIMSIDIPEHHGELDIKFCYSKVDETISIKNASGYWNFMNNIFDKALFTGAAASDTWATGWTTFYWSNWMAWAPVAAVFLAILSVISLIYVMGNSHKFEVHTQHKDKTETKNSDDQLVKWDEGTEVVANANDVLEWTKAHLGIKYLCPKVAINNLSKMIERWW